MKILLLVSIITTLVILSHTQDEFINELVTKRHPRKIKSVQILNPRKFLKVRSSESRRWNLKKRVERGKSYTVFPPINNRQEKLGAPESLFFQPEHDAGLKLRVKKVLPDYGFTLSRSKRSANDNGNNNLTQRTQKSKKIKRDGDEKVKDVEKSESSGKKKQPKSSSKGIGSFRSNDTAKDKIKNKKGRKSTRPTVELKYTKKSRKRRSRKGRRHDKEKRREEKIQKKYDRIEKHHKKRRHRKDNRAKRRLIAGRDAMIADYPYVVSIQKGKEHWCAGALLNQRLAITTANCVWKSESLSRLRVRAGARHADRGGQVAKIQEVMKHPFWSIRKKPDNDIALLLLDRVIRFSDSVHSLDLPNYAMSPAFEDAWVTSWGAERRDGIFENTELTLQVYHASLISNARCNNITQRFGVRVSDNFICLAQTGRRAPCTRDTGAPAVSDGVLWGLASWGIRKLCGTERFPAMFSYTASKSNLDFILNATHYLMSDKRYYPFPDRFVVQRSETTTEVTEAMQYF